MKTILVPTDFSPNADKALAFAVRIARRSGAEIILLHVCDLFDIRLSRNKDLIAEHNRLVTSDLNRKLERYRLSAADQNVTITNMLYSGQPVQTILAVSGEAEVDLIVMGTQGATGIRSVLVGTNSGKVLSRSTVPVLTIPCHYEPKDPERVLIAANEEEAGAKLNPVIELAELFGAHLYAVTISHDNNDPSEAVQKSRIVEKLHSGIKSQFESTVNAVHLTGSNFYSVMNEYIASEQIDMLVMFTHEKSIIENIFNGSMTKKMAYHTHIPLLSIKM
jgi:nucleotide-binding universal stress UspA family protein